MISLFAGLLLAVAADIDVPRNDGWVTDLAGLLSPQEELALESLMESYKRGTTHEIALLTVESLGGEPIERFALEVARSWGIGGKDANNGALLVVAKGDRKMRIEVGRGLEGNLTDSIAGRIIRDVIAPEFKRGRFNSGLGAGIRSMHAAIGGDYGPIHQRRGGRAAQGSIVGCLFLFMFAMLLMGMVARRRTTGRGTSRVGGFLPFLILAGMSSGRRGGFGGGGAFGGGGSFGGFGGGGGFSGGGASGGW